jgi:hypothetical protein
MKIETKLKLGTSTNLLYGYNDNWLSGSMGNEGIFTSPAKPLNEIEVDLEPDTHAGWSYPNISLHETPESLLTTLFPISNFDPSDGTHAPVLPPGFLLLGDANRATAITQLSKTLGVDLSNSDYRFVLVQLQRNVGQVKHPILDDGLLVHANPLTPDPKLGVNADFLAEIKKLRHGEKPDGTFSPANINVNDANDYLNVFSNYGTHFVSRMTMGDTIFQVFAMPSTRFEDVKKAYSSGKNPLNGQGSEAFSLFTSDANTGAFGYVKEFGNIISFSNDPALAAALNNKDWLEPTFATNNSIFAPFEDSAKINFTSLNTNYTQITPIKVEVSTLGLFAEYNRKRLWQRIFKGGVIQKYKSAIQPNFLQNGNPKIEDDFPQQDVSGFYSTISTPTINVYKPKIDLGNLQFVAPEIVNTMTLATNLLNFSVDTDVFIPGNDVLLMAQYANFESETTTKTISLTDAGFNTAIIHFREFFGALLVKNQSNSKHFTIVDGLKYESKSNATIGRDDVFISSDCRTIPATVSTDRIINNFNFAFTFAESIINGNKLNQDDNFYLFIKESLEWIVEFLPKNSSNTDVLDLRLRALDLRNYMSNPALGTFVPILPFKDYDTYISKILDFVGEINTNIRDYEAQITARKQLELVIDTAKSLNENIIDSGNLLSKYVDTTADFQQQMNFFYNSITTQKQVELKTQKIQIGILEKSLNDQQAEVKTAILNYKQAIADQHIMDAIMFALDIVGAIFEIGATFAVPSEAVEALGSLGKIAGQIKKMMTVLAAVGTAYSDVVKPGIKEMQNANATLDELDKGGFDILDQLSWDDAALNLKKILKAGPSGDIVDGAKEKLATDFKILVQRGKAMITAQAQAHQLSRDIYLQQRQQDVNEAQATRLKALKSTLKNASINDLNRSNIDLVGLTGNLDFLRNQMAGMLSKAFTLQDQALQYQYLQPATAITDFSLLGFKKALSLQAGKTLDAKSKLLQIQTSITKPIDFVIESVSLNDIINGNAKDITIQPDNILFLKFATARVKSVIASVVGVKSLANPTGHYLLELNCTGQPFFDRNTERNTLAFNTPSRRRTYEYEAGSNDPQFTDNGNSWSNDVNPVTPFTTWQISFPKTKSNVGIEFLGSTVDIKLTFVLDTRIIDQPTNLSRSARPSFARSGAPSAAGGVILPSKEDLVTNMYNQGSGLNGWDVVFSMTLGQINNALASQYNDLKNNGSFANKIHAVVATHPIEGATATSTFDLKYGVPKLAFLENDLLNVSLEMEISEGTLTKCLQMGDNSPQCNPAVMVKNMTVKAFIPLSMVDGLVKSAGGGKVYSVVLDMAKGTFKANNIALSDVEQLEFNKALVAYFVQNEVKYIINSLDLSKYSTLDDLRPNQFNFKTLKTPGGNLILQIFIQTNTRNLLNYSQTFLNNIPEPIPQGFQCSLMVSSKIWFANVMAQSISQSGWQLAGVDPGTTNKAWQAKFTSGTVTGVVDLSFLNNTRSSRMSENRETYSLDPKFSITNMLLKPRTDGQIDLSFSSVEKPYINRHNKVTSYSTGSVKETDNRIDISFTLTIAAQVPLSITGAGQDQKIKIALANQSVNIVARTSGGGPCGCDDLEAQVNTKLKEQVPPQILSKLNINFDPVSVFALKNLLFPAKNFINLQETYVPGDVLILGNFAS